MAGLITANESRRRAQPGRHYFPIVGLLLLAVTLLGFSDNLFTDVGQRTNSDPKFVVHGLFCLAWMVLMAAQPLLVQQGNVRLHRRIGIAGMIIAVGVTLSTLYVFVVIWKGWAALEPDAKANRLLLPSFALCVAMAWRYRRQPQRHKRLLAFASFYMLGPILSRAYDHGPVLLMWDWPVRLVDDLFLPYLWLTWFGFCLSLIIYDVRTRGRVSRISSVGTAWLATVVTLAQIL